MTFSEQCGRTLGTVPAYRSGRRSGRKAKVPSFGCVTGLQMGTVINLEERRRARDARPPAPPKLARAELAFDLGDPFSYLAAERIERAFDAVTWTPAAAPAPAPARGGVAERARAEARARELRLPLVWPERHPAPVTCAMRAAALAVASGRGAEFTLAAGRLAFCGGFDLEDPEVLLEAAAAAGLGFDAVLEAAVDPRLDAAIVAAGERLRRAGADRLPALRVGEAVFCGEERIAEAAAAARWVAAADL
jgi:2-hydroxychromene-2-carboxylate isomerase